MNNKYIDKTEEAFLEVVKAIGKYVPKDKQGKVVVKLQKYVVALAEERIARGDYEI